MAVEDKYVHPNVVTSTDKVSESVDSIWAKGKKVMVAHASFAVAAADDDTSIYRLFRDLSPSIQIQQMWVGNAAITGGTSYALRIYESGVGKAIVSGSTNLSGVMDLSTAHATLAPGTALNGLAGLALTDFNKKLFELAGHTEVTKKKSYDIALLATTAGSGAGQVNVMMLYGQDG